MKTKVHTIYYRSFGEYSEYTTLLRVYEDLDEACKYVNKSNEQLKKKLLHRSNRQYVDGNFIKNKNKWNGFAASIGGAEVILGKEVDFAKKKSVKVNVKSVEFYGCVSCGHAQHKDRPCSNELYNGYSCRCQVRS